MFKTLRLLERINELEERIKLLQRDLMHDPLTGLKTRQFLEEEGGVMVRQASDSYLPIQRREWSGFRDLSVVFIDIDDFKSINDTYGHAAGDEAIRKVSRTILESIREEDIAARWGGEEIIVLLPNANPEQAKKVVEHIMQKLESLEFKEIRDKSRKVTISAGIASVEGEMSYDAVIRHADEAMYKAKKSGKNRIVLYSEMSKSQ